MAESLRSMSESERKAAIARRLSSNTKGLGYWAAVDAQARLTKRTLYLCRCGEDCIPMLGENTCVRCDLAIGTSQ